MHRVQYVVEARIPGDPGGARRGVMRELDRIAARRSLDLTMLAAQPIRHTRARTSLSGAFTPSLALTRRGAFRAVPGPGCKEGSCASGGGTSNERSRPPTGMKRFGWPAAPFPVPNHCRPVSVCAPSTDDATASSVTWEVP
jgi:hypothetical protein